MKYKLVRKRMPFCLPGSITLSKAQRRQIVLESFNKAVRTHGKALEMLSKH